MALRTTPRTAARARRRRQATARDNCTPLEVRRAFFRNATMAPDELRQRAAFAPPRILVVSATQNPPACAMQRDQQMAVALAGDVRQRRRAARKGARPR